jgi:hypothetical protein
VLLQCARDAQHLLPVREALLGAQHQEKPRDVPGAAGVELVQHRARLVEAPFIEQEFGARHRLRDLPFGAPLPGLLEPPVPACEIAQPLRGARGDQSGEARCGAQIEGLGRQLLRADEPAFEQGLDRTERRLVTRLGPAAPAKGADVRRQPQRVPDQPDEEIQERKADDHEHREKIERQLGPPRREHEQDVAAVPAHQQGERDRECGEHQQPQQAPHCGPRSRGTL